MKRLTQAKPKAKGTEERAGSATKPKGPQDRAMGSPPRGLRKDGRR